ncbi:hypothetical protein ACP70R_041264 [Stipagrostis hirtigluma subsp. patula]
MTDFDRFRSKYRNMSGDRQEVVCLALSIYYMCKGGIVILLLGCAVLLIGHNSSAVCTRVLLWPTIAIGLFLMTPCILLCCCSRSGCDRDCLAVLYGVVFILGTVSLLALLIFGYIAVGGPKYGKDKVREYDLKDYSGWLRGRTDDQQYWDTLSACLRRKHACKRMTTRQLVRDPDTGIFVPKPTSDEIQERKNDPDTAPPAISPIESGCCKPPSSCGFTYVNGTTWTPAPGAPAAETDVDCSRWSNDQQELCFQCDSCKAGLLHDIKKGWSMSAIGLIVMLVGPIIVVPCILMCASG